MFWFAFFLIWIPCGFYAAATAEDKGHGGLAWFFGGLVFGPFALIACAGLSDRKLRRFIRLMAENQGVDVSEPLAVTDVANEIIKEQRNGGPGSWNEETQSWEPIKRS